MTLKHKNIEIQRESMIFLKYVFGKIIIKTISNNKQNFNYFD